VAQVPFRLADRRWPELEARRVVLAVPVGSCEQHGPHLPLSTDTLIAEALADRLATARDDVIVTPALTITASGEHAAFPGTLSIGTAVMQQVVVELARSADWAAGVLLVNGHGGNADAIRGALSVLRAEGRRVLAWWPTIADGDLHAGVTETSIVLALRPDLVDIDHAAAGPTPTIDALRELGVRSLSPTGVLGDPAGASVEHGESLLYELASDLERCVVAWQAA
jgi:mycofactocin precursor peptide peptidase